MEIAKYDAPYRHVVIDGWADVQGLSLPPADWPHWIRYASAVERKRTCERLDLLPPRVALLANSLRLSATLDRLTELTGIAGLSADPDLRGGGVHVTDPGGFLGVHLDYEIHPTRFLERRLNAILFLNETWNDEWRGALELWDADARLAVTKIYPRPGRLVLFECGESSYHGMPQPLACPADQFRATIAVAYLTPPRGRRRALFIPVRD